MTFKDYISEDKTDDELKAGLQSFVDDYKKARKAGNVKLAKELKGKIEKLIQQKGLDAKKVWGKDPDKK